MFLDIRQNSSLISTNSSNPGYFAECNDMYEGVVVWACFGVVCVLFGFPACLAVLWEQLQRHRRGISATPNDVFMLNLTVMDLAFLSFSPLGICNYVFWYIWPIEVIFNVIYAFPMTGRPLFMTCICLDCYLAVVHPITYRARKGLTSRVLMSIGVWAVTLVYGALFAIFHINTTIIEYPVRIVYVFTILTIIICDFFIIRALRSSDPGGQDLHPQKKKALQIILNSLVMTIIAYLPPMLCSFYTPTPLTEDVFMCRVFFTVYCSVIAGSAIMPVLHLSNLNKLDFIKLWCCKAA